MCPIATASAAWCRTTSRRVEKTVLVSTPEELGAPVVSPDGKTLAYLHGRTELRTLAVDVESR